VPTGRVSHPIFARYYARVSPSMEAGGMADYRQQLLAGLTGPVIEIGAGNGANFSHYPPGVTRVLAVEPDPHLRQIATGNAARARVPVEVTDGVAEALPVDDGTYQSAVVTLVLCSVSDVQAALREIYRVLRPRGQLRFLEHVCGTTPCLRRVQRFLDATIWPVLLGGCHTARDTAAAIKSAGFTIESLDRFRYPDTRLTLPATPHVRGIASR
jgi:ubiquinone/menaquinone biosynthesis C-methylase UbiE